MGLAAFLVALAWVPAVAHGQATPVAGSVGETRVVAVLTGKDSINDTATSYSVSGTDPGSSFEHNGAIYMVFGDTFGKYKADWRSNVAAIITDDDPTDCLTFDRMIEDNRVTPRCSSPSTWSKDPRSR